MMNLICRLKGHVWVFQENVESGSLYNRDHQIVIRAKEYKCSRCNEVQSGLSVTKEDHDALIYHSKLAQAEYQMELSTLPQRVKLLEEKLEKENPR